MGVTYGFLRFSDGSTLRLQGTVSTTELELQTDTNDPGGVPSAQGIGDAAMGKTLTQATFTEAGGDLLYAYLMSKAGAVKAAFSNIAATQQANLGVLPVTKSVKIDVGDQIRCILKSGSKAAVAVLNYANGMQQIYTTDASSTGTLTLTEFKTSNGLGTSGSGIGPLASMSIYGVTGLVTLAAIVDNQGNLRWTAPGASVGAGGETQVARPLPVGITPGLNWSLQMVVA